MANLPTASKLIERQRSAGQAVRANIEDLRRRIADLQTNRERVERLPDPPENAEARLDAWLDSIEADPGDMGLRGFMRGVRGFMRGDGGRPRLPVSHHPGSSVPDMRWASDMLLGLLVASNRRAVRDLFAGWLADAYEGRETASAKDRAARIEKIDADLAQLELAEEALIRAAEGAGVAVLRREDADPAAVLAADTALPS